MSLEQQVKELGDELRTAHQQFKNKVDQELAEAKKLGAATSETKAAVERANADISKVDAKIDGLTTQIKALENENARLALVSNPHSAEARERERGFAAALQSRLRNTLVLARDVTEDQLAHYRAYKGAFECLMRRGDQALTSEFRAALSQGTDSSGGIWAPPDLNGRLIQLLFETSPMRSVANVESIALEAQEGYTDLNEVGSGWVGETTARPETGTPDVGGWRIPLYEQYVNPRATQKMLDFSIRDVEGWLAGKIRDKVSRQENTRFVSGTVDNKSPRGFLSYAAGVPSATAWNVIEQVGTGSSGAFAAAPAGFDVFLDTIGKMKAPYLQGAAWAMNRVTQAAARKQKDSNGRFIWEPGGQAGKPNEIFGYPVLSFEDMPVYTGANALAIAFANWKEAYTVIDHLTGVRILRDNLTAKPWVQFYTTKYCGGDVVNFEAIKIIKFG